MNLIAERRRLIWMAVWTGVAFLVALAGMVGYAALHTRWGLALFALGIVGGVGAQLRFIMGVARAAPKV